MEAAAKGEPASRLEATAPPANLKSMDILVRRVFGVDGSKLALEAVRVGVASLSVAVLGVPHTEGRRDMRLALMGEVGVSTAARAELSMRDWEREAGRNIGWKL